jgi:GAF domain-containing protein
VDAAPLTEAERLGRVYFPDGGAALEELRSGELVVIEDCDAQKSAYPLICGWLGTAGRRSALIAPLLADGQLFGVIGYGLEVVHRFDDEELGTVRSFAAQANQALGRALAIEAEHLSRDRLSSLATFSAVLAEAVTLDDVIDGIVESATPLLGAVGVRVAILDETKSTLSVARRGGLLAGELDEAAGIDAATIAGHAVRTREVVIRPDRSELVASFPESSIPEGPEMGRVIAAPLLDDGEPIGAWVLVFAESGPPDDDDVRLVRLFIDRAASAIRRARMYEFERGVAVTLQRSLLADVPTVPGWSIDTWYEPGSEYLEVGGDLYDVTVLGDGRLVVIVGDVVGHGLPAASAMGQLRSAGTALAIVTTNPTAVLCGLDQFARVTPGVMYSSLCCVMLHPDGTGSYACAGHPPPILVRADGSTVVLDGGRSALLGVEVDRHHEAPLVVEEGATLVVFTDGLIERRSVPVALTLNRLRDQLSAMDFTVKGRAEEIGRAMLENDAPADDVVVVRLTRTTTP